MFNPQLVEAEQRRFSYLIRPCEACFKPVYRCLLDRHRKGPKIKVVELDAQPSERGNYCIIEDSDGVYAHKGRVTFLRLSLHKCQKAQPKQFEDIPMF